MSAFVRAGGGTDKNGTSVRLPEALARGLELNTKAVEYNDLDALIGSWQEDKGFERAIADFERIDEDEQ